MHHTKSSEFFQIAQQVIPGGVNSPVRAFKSVGTDPIFYDRAKGDRVWDVDGNEYIDFVGSWGPMILGHAPDAVLDAVRAQLDKGTSYGAPTMVEIEMAEKLVEVVPSIEMVRMVSSGTEATMSAIRLARGYTGREKFIKFDGNYHGHSDALLVAAGIGPAHARHPVDARRHQGRGGRHDRAAVQRHRRRARRASRRTASRSRRSSSSRSPATWASSRRSRASCRACATLCDEHGVVLIFDEVITGFRVALGGAQELYGVTPDLTTLGKIIGGGFPVGAFGGKAEIMELARAGRPGLPGGHAVGQPGRDGRRPRAHRRAVQAGRLRGARAQGQAPRRRPVPRGRQRRRSHTSCNRVGSMSTMFFTAPRGLELGERLDERHRARTARYFRGMLEAGLHDRAEPVRGVLRLARAHRRGHRRVLSAAATSGGMRRTRRYAPQHGRRRHAQ